MTAWTPQVFTPWPAHPGVLMARVAARSAAFDGTSAAGGASVLVGSAAGHDRDRVVLGARGELLERLGNVLAGREAEAAAGTPAGTVGTRHGLAGAGVLVLAPEERPEGRRLWVRGRTHRGEPVLVAAGAAFLQHRPPPGCERLPRTGSTGVASHPDPEAAARHAAWEVLERDLVRRSWFGLTEGAPRRVRAVLPPALAELARDQAFLVTAFLLPAPAGAACAVACVHRVDGTGQTFGARCGPGTSVPELVEKAVYEALMVRWSMGTEVARRTWEQWRGQSPPTTAVQHALWAYHRQDSLRLWGVARESGDGPSQAPPAGAPDAPPDVPAERPFPADADAGPGSGAVDPVRVLAGHTGRDVVLVDTTGRPAREAGVRVVRVLAPGARQLPSGTGPGHPHPFG